MKGLDLSVVVPVYNEEAYLQNFFDGLQHEVHPKNSEIIFVNDGSTDFSAKILDDIANDHPFVKIITLAKNYGKQIAVTAGMQHATGNAVVVMNIRDGKPFLALQDMLALHNAGADIVRGFFNKNQNWFKKFLNVIKNGFLRFFTKFFGYKNAVLESPAIELYDQKIAAIINGIPGKNLRLRRTDCFFGYEIKELFFDKYNLSDAEKAKIATTKKELDELRIKQAMPNPEKMKKRLYGPSIWTSYAFMVAFGVFLLLTLVLLLFKVQAIWILLMIVLMVFCIFLSFSFVIRAFLIKRIGLTIFLPPGEKLYEIKNKTNF